MYVYFIVYGLFMSEINVRIENELNKVSYPEEYSTSNDISYQALG